MHKPATENPDATPFHAGELAFQERVGKRKSVAAFANRAIRTFMPDQHRDFYSQLPFMIVGSVDDQGRPWSSILTGDPGFVQSSQPTSLELQPRLLPGDPLRQSMQPGKPLGMLGIELSTRRRNRVNGHVHQVIRNGFSMMVDQSFGNCPQYIQRRQLHTNQPTHIDSGIAFRNVYWQGQDLAHGSVDQPDSTHAAEMQGPEPAPETLHALDEDARLLIGQADTFFVASHASSNDDGRMPEDIDRSHGVDVSHRGGQAGFVRIDGNSLTIPDFAGNNLFNTLGNFLVNPQAGLLFLDFRSGDLLQMTGSVELLWPEDPDVAGFQGAERGWRFHLQQALRWRQALPFRASLVDHAPESLMTGTWQDQVQAKTGAKASGPRWTSCRIARIVDESTIIRSFYLQPTDGTALPDFRAGQHIRLRLTLPGQKRAVMRNYTLSSTPINGQFRISVKREAQGQVSQYLHDRLSVGDTLHISQPAGDFWLDPDEHRPAVLLAAGVGVTPMIAMARQVIDHGKAHGHVRQLQVLHACHLNEQRAFAEEFLQLEQQSHGRLHYHRFVSEAKDNEQAGRDHDHIGRIDASALRSLLALDDYDFMLCGPAGFMQALHDALLELGVSEQRIHAEAFGPARLQRSEPIQDTSSAHSKAVNTTEEAAESRVSFIDENTSALWAHGGPTLLELAEEHGLTPAFSCRSGSCGSCAARLVDGKVHYRRPITADVDEQEILLCCAVPARGSDKLSISLQDSAA